VKETAVKPPGKQQPVQPMGLRGTHDGLNLRQWHGTTTRAKCQVAVSQARGAARHCLPDSPPHTTPTLSLSPISAPAAGPFPVSPPNLSPEGIAREPPTQLGPAPAAQLPLPRGPGARGGAKKIVAPRRNTTGRAQREIWWLSTEQQGESFLIKLTRFAC
jgi:hypothetical protein